MPNGNLDERRKTKVSQPSRYKRLNYKLSCRAELRKYFSLVEKVLKAVKATIPVCQAVKARQMYLFKRFDSASVG